MKKFAMCSLLLVACVCLAPQASAAPDGAAEVSPDGWIDQLVEWVAEALGLDAELGIQEPDDGEALQLFGTEPSTTTEAQSTEEGDRATGIDPNGHTSE